MRTGTHFNDEAYDRSRRSSQDIGELRRKGILKEICNTTLSKVNQRSKREGELQIPRSECVRMKGNLARTIIGGNAKWKRGLVKIATLNCQGINETNKRDAIESWATNNNIKIMAIQETRHPYTAEEGGRAKMNPEGVIRGGLYKWFYGTGSKPEDVDKMQKEREEHGKASKETYDKACEHGGVAFLVHKSLWQNIKRIETAGSRLIKITIKMNKMTDLISAYAPHAEKTEDEKVAFYEDLQKLVDDRPNGNEILILGDLNARMIKAEDDQESTVFGKATVKGRSATVEGMSAATESNRNHLIRFCLRNGLQLSNTFFEKPTNKLVTFRPREIEEWRDITENTHEQIDYVISKKGHIRITNCETDTAALLRSDHYPLMASYRMKFKPENNRSEANHKYNSNSLWKDKDRLNADLTRYAEQGHLNYKTYKDWIEANKWAVSEQTPKDKTHRLEYVSEITKSLIDERDKAIREGK